MNIKTVIGLLFIIIFIFTLQSCGTDSTTNPVTPSGTVLYSRDSISVWLPPSAIASGTDSLSYSTTNSGGVKVEFTLSSNADSSHSIGNWSIYTNASPAVIVNHPVYSPIDSSFESINFNFASGQSTYFSLAVRLNVNNNVVAHYIRLKNVKITKL